MIGLFEDYVQRGWGQNRPSLAIAALRFDSYLVTTPISEKLFLPSSEAMISMEKGLLCWFILFVNYHKLFDWSVAEYYRTNNYVSKVGRKERGMDMQCNFPSFQRLVLRYSGLHLFIKFKILSRSAISR